MNDLKVQHTNLRTTLYSNMNCLQTITLFLLISDISAAEIFSACEEVSAPPVQLSCTNGSLPCSEQSADSCPPALFCKEGECVCGKYPFNFVKCNGYKSSVKTEYCVTYDKDLNTTLVGRCSFISNWHLRTEAKLFYQLPPSVHQLDHVMCSFYNRTGTLCGRCLPDHYPLAYSFNMTCIPCPHVRWNWFRCIMAAYLPLTAFCIVMLFFKINVTSSHLFAVVYFCQAITTPIVLRGLFATWQLDSPSFVLLKVIISLYSIWNLDFFRPFYSDLCLGIGILPTLALDYAVAAYPLLLMALTYLFIHLHDKNYRVIVFMWSPFRKLCTFFRKNWDIRTSVIDAFSTFFLLCNVKFLSVSVDLLSPVNVFQLYPLKFNHTVGLFYAANIEYFSSEHLPYALLAIAVLCVFVFLPLFVLALYQFALFQKFLSLFKFRWYVLQTFMDSFHSSYKDGTQHATPTRDYRWFVSAFFFMRIAQYVLYNISDISIFTSLTAILLVFFTLSFATLHPFSSSSHNTINIVFLLFQILLYVLALGDTLAAHKTPSLRKVFIYIGIIPVFAPPVYFAVAACFWAYKHRRFSFGLTRRLRAWRSGYSQLCEVSEHLPDRMENSGQYPRENLANFTSSHREGTQGV